MVVLILLGTIPLFIFTLIFINTYRSKAISQRINELQARGSVICNLVIYVYLSSDQQERCGPWIPHAAEMCIPDAGEPFS